jgi:prepilin-type N-terminal cleavage/methylation domain-containing protein
MPTQPRKSVAGFTLLELLVVLVIAGFVFVLLGEGVRTSLSSWTRQAHDLEAGGDVSIFDETLRQLIARIDPGLSAGDPAMFEGNAHVVRFIADDRAFQLSVIAGQRLALAWTGAPGQLPRAGVSTLLEGVERLDVQYWRPGVGWAGTWTARPLPALIRFHVAFPKGSGRHVPDLIAAPMRETWRS